MKPTLEERVSAEFKENHFNGINGRCPTCGESADETLKFILNAMQQAREEERKEIFKLFTMDKWNEIWQQTREGHSCVGRLALLDEVILVICMCAIVVVATIQSL